MGTPTTDVEICNLALGRIGQKEIASISAPTTLEEDACALYYAPTRRELLRAFVFNFAKAYAVLTVSESVTPAFGFASAFALPNDYLRLLALGDHTINDDVPAGLYDIVNGYIYTDWEDDTDSINISYIKDETSVTKWDASFVKLAYTQLAHNMAPKFTLKPSTRKDLADELRDLLLKAAAVAGQEKPPRRIQRSRVRDLRRMGGTWRDTTRYPL